MYNTSYEEAKTILKECGFETKQNYLKEARKFYLPLDPEEAYKDEWEGWEIYLSSLFSYGTPSKQSESDKIIDEWLRRPLY